MRKVLIATIVAMVLFAVGAFAAALTLEPTDLASGGADVVACNPEPDVDFEVGAYDEGIDDWEVSGVVVNTGTACPDGTEVEVVLLDSPDGDVLATATGSISGGTTAPALAFDPPVGAAATEWFAVLLNGEVAS